MSYRLVILPAYFDNTLSSVIGVDEQIPLGATDAYMIAVAKRWAWKKPLKIWTPDETDSRYVKLVQELKDRGMEPDQDFVTYTKPL